MGDVPFRRAAPEVAEPVALFVGLLVIVVAAFVNLSHQGHGTGMRGEAASLADRLPTPAPILPGPLVLAVTFPSPWDALTDGEALGAEQALGGMFDELRGLVRAVESANPARPVVLAIVVPTSAPGGATAVAGGGQDVQRYIDYAASRDMLVILRPRMGGLSARGELESIEGWLERPNVHLMLDATAAPGDGQDAHASATLDADDVADAQAFLAALSAEHDLPSKLLVVHQRADSPVLRSEDLWPHPGVQLVLSLDALGTPATEGGSSADVPFVYNGLVIRPQEDRRAPTAREVRSLEPSADLITIETAPCCAMLDG